MNASTISRLLASIAVVILSVALNLHGPTASAAPGGGDKLPYFKVFGGDVKVGGAYNTTKDSADCSSFGSYYQSSTNVPATPGAGGIYAYAKDNGVNSAGGASGDYGVFATGPVEGNSASKYGFYSAGALAAGPGNTKKNLLTFTDTISGTAWGGNFDGSGPNLTNCIPDYYDLKVANASAGWPGLGGAAGTYLVNGNYTLSGGAVTTNQTLIVNGSVTISSNITYSAGAAADAVPKFELIAKGDIYVLPAVSRLDGFYVAQPTNTSSTDGIIWTCQDPAANPNKVSIWFNTNCTNKLTINGAISARQVNLMREQGDVNNGSAKTNEGPGSNNVAEEINYIPAMVIGGSFEGQTNNSKFKVDQVINLPPVF